MTGTARGDLVRGAVRRPLKTRPAAPDHRPDGLAYRCDRTHGRHSRPELQHGDRPEAAEKMVKRFQRMAMAVDTQRPIGRIRESLEVAGFDRLVTRVFFAVLPTGQSALKAIFDNLVSDL